MLVSVHADSNDNWNWRAIAAAHPPHEPSRAAAAETSARQALAVYSPGFFDKLFGGAAKQRSLLEVEIQRAIAITSHPVRSVSHARHARSPRSRAQSSI